MQNSIVEEVIIQCFIPNLFDAIGFSETMLADDHLDCLWTNFTHILVKSSIIRCSISDQNFPTVIADELSRYFSSIGTELSQSVPYTHGDFNDYLGQRKVNHMTLTPITENEIINIMNEFFSRT